MAVKPVKTRTPGIYKRGSRYVFSYRVDGRQRWESCRTTDEARRAKAARTTDIGRGEFEGRSRATPHVFALDGAAQSRYGRREVPIDRSLALTLREHHKGSEWPEGEGLVFPASNGSPLTQSNVFRRILQPAREEACLPWVGFHAFRHTCASMLFAEGRNAVQVQRWLGHHSPAFTLATYVHLLDSDLGEPLAILQEGGHDAELAG